MDRLPDEWWALPLLITFIFISTLIIWAVSIMIGVLILGELGIFIGLIIGMIYMLFATAYLWETLC